MFVTQYVNSSLYVDIFEEDLIKVQTHQKKHLLEELGF